MSSKNFQFLYISAIVLTLAGAVLHLVLVRFSTYIFSAGALLLIILHLINVFKTKTEDKQQERLTRIGLIASLFLALAAYFMFKDSNSWVVAVLLYALITFYISFRTK